MAPISFGKGMEFNKSEDTEGSKETELEEWKEAVIKPLLENSENKRKSLTEKVDVLDTVLGHFSISLTEKEKIAELSNLKKRVREIKSHKFNIKNQEIDDLRNKITGFMKKNF